MLSRKHVKTEFMKKSIHFVIDRFFNVDSTCFTHAKSQFNFALKHTNVSTLAPQTPAKEPRRDLIIAPIDQSHDPVQIEDQQKDPKMEEPQFESECGFSQMAGPQIGSTIQPSGANFKNYF